MNERRLLFPSPLSCVIAVAATYYTAVMTAAVYTLDAVVVVSVNFAAVANAIGIVHVP